MGAEDSSSMALEPRSPTLIPILRNSSIPDGNVSFQLIVHLIFLLGVIHIYLTLYQTLTMLLLLDFGF